MLVNRTKGTLITRNVVLARGIMRGIGLMFRKNFDGALIFENVGKTSFHGWFCRFPILLVCIRGKKVTEKRVLRPWHVEYVDCDTVIELDARKNWDIDVGDVLEWEGKGDKA